MCRSCSEAGRVVEATEVDHIIAHRGDQALFWDESNWQPLCKPCHSAKTQEEMRSS
ncbi:HNH endonuclease signature motif containing protein [Pseudomonas aeruginosa]|uniref:HNH endonuclease signature motif containing protein n=1 Tax=Pseudomonas aeruginosa TaxID=287 RepID=UPI0039B4954C